MTIVHCSEEVCWTSVNRCMSDSGKYIYGHFGSSVDHMPLFVHLIVVRLLKMSVIITRTFLVVLDVYQYV